MAFEIPAADAAVFKQASLLETGGMRAFTSYMFADISKKPRWDLVGVRIDLREELGFDSATEYVPWVPLDWQFALAHATQMDSTIIGGMGCSKTVGAGACGVYWCCQLPSFRFLGCGPTSYQASQMHEAVRTELLDWKRQDEIPRPIHKYVKKIVDRPWPRIEFWNGSTMEFMSGDMQGQKILTWSGDVVVVDQAESFDDLERLMENLGTRTRGIVQDRERLGKLILLANAEYHPALWERFDMGLTDVEGSLPEHYLSILLTTYDNPYLSKKQVEAFERRIVDPERQRQLLLSERPIPRGKEFTAAILEPAQAPSMDENMAHQLQEGTPGYQMQTMRRAGTWLWETPYNEFSEYIVTGDPGQNCPPYRNSPCVVAFDVTDFPDRPAELAAFWWGDGKGSYWPFIYKFEEYCQIYKPRARAFDATGSQKGFDELCFQQRGLVVEGLNMQKWKMQMIVTLKLLLGKELLRMPKGIQGIWMQLAGWHMPDKKLRQDVASTLFMAAFLINRLYMLSDLQEGDTLDMPEEGDGEERFIRNRILRQDRHERMER